MSGLATNSNDSSRGGLGIVLLVFFTVGFALTIGGQAILGRLTGILDLGEPVNRAEVFDATPVADLIQPQPDFSPDKVVTLQIEGLSKSNISAGIQQCFVFASPNNKEITGPVTRFAEMVRTPPYDALMHHQLALVGQPALVDDTAVVMVTLLDAHDEIRVFQFVLSKQHDEALKDCWMTDAVYPVGQLFTEPPADTPSAGDLSSSSARLAHPSRAASNLGQLFTPQWGYDG